MFQLLLTMISLTGTFLNCRKMKICFILWIICNAGWICVDFNARAYSRMLLDVVQTIFCIYGYINWLDEKS